MRRARMLAGLLVASACVSVLGRGLAPLGIVPSLAQPRDREAGRSVFVGKLCARCHPAPGEPGAGPPIEALRRPQGEMELAGRLWNHVPTMFGALGEAAAQWPPISASEMAALMAYLGADASRDPAPDVGKGQATLMRKGCLKCHSLRREGGRVEPDLADRRSDYESAAAWAAAMWTHTPRMAAMAAQQSLMYPRFSGDEMGHLLAFLRSSSARSPGR